MKTQVLIENLQPSEANIICESTSDKSMWLNGVYMQAEVKNRNNRVYPLSEMTKAVKQAMQMIQENGGIFGELDHPKDLNINMDRISHAIKELRLEGSNVYGRAKLLKTPMGCIAEELGKSGVKYGVSSRGGGQLDESGRVSDFVFITADLVATPSAQGAFPEPVYESLHNTKHGYKALTLAESVRNDPSAQKYLAKEVNKFLEEIFKK